MSKTAMLALTLTGLALLARPTLAAPAATQEEADRLKSVFERYVGHPAAGETGSVTISPEGTSYRTTLDYQAITRPLQSFGLTVEAASQALLLTPNDNGTWHVAGDAMPPLVIHLKDQTLTMKASTYKYDGTYDPKLGFFTDQTVAQDGATLDQEAPTLSQRRRTGHSVLTSKAVPAEGGRADVDAHYALSDVTAEMIMRSPPPPASVAVEPTSPPVPFGYSLPTSTVDVHIDHMQSWSLLDLWAFFVAHPNRDAVTGAQDELRGLLKAALPVIGGLKEKASAEGLSVQSQFGEFKARIFGASFDVSGIPGTAKIASTLMVDGLVLPSLTLPAWSTGLLPTTLDLHPSVEGLHIDEAAREAVERFDLAHDGLSPEQSQKIGHILWPGDGKIMLAPSHIGTPLIDLKFDGEASLGDVPAGHLTVTGTGFDKAIAMLQAVADTDDTAAQVLAQMTAAKNLAKSNPDGSLTWVIEAVANGPLSVNGVPLK